ncbi:MAG TPA: hypothetical protein VG318_08845 [Actinomycetota bacterium]|nr:hypothetical protein [Actinomycetota bacterium]
MEPGEVIWEGKIGTTNLRVGVPHSEAIIAEWDTPKGSRHKVSDSIQEFERAVLFQLLLNSGDVDENATADVIAAVEKAQAERPKRQPEGDAPRRRKNPKVRQHRRSRRPPRRR